MISAPCMQIPDCRWKESRKLRYAESSKTEYSNIIEFKLSYSHLLVSRTVEYCTVRAAYRSALSDLTRPARLLTCINNLIGTA